MLLVYLLLLISPSSMDKIPEPQDKMETVTLAGGCFWCVEAIYEDVNGVVSVKSGYMGGHIANPTYQDVINGRSGHAEVIQLLFNPATISYAEILEIFWKTHDPTTLNYQGNDVGTQYRSEIFYHNKQQKITAEKYLAQLEESNVFPGPIVTKITVARNFYEAEEYHQNYYSLNSNQPYCQYVIKPKMEKFRKDFKSKLKN